MVQKLLAERFGLSSSRKEGTFGYVITVDKLAEDN